MSYSPGSTAGKNCRFAFSESIIIYLKLLFFRTFLESEVTNPVLRRDLYDKMVALDPAAATAEERESQSITKMRYMQVLLLWFLYVTHYVCMYKQYGQLNNSCPLCFLFCSVL